jgi:hypothetical protein
MSETRKDGQWEVVRTTSLDNRPLWIVFSLKPFGGKRQEEVFRTFHHDKFLAFITTAFN